MTHGVVSGQFRRVDDEAFLPDDEMAGIALVEVRMSRPNPRPVARHRRHQRSAVGVDGNERSRAGSPVLEETRGLYRRAVLHVEHVCGNRSVPAAKPKRLGRKQRPLARHRDVGTATVIAKKKALGLSALRNARVVRAAGQVEHGRSGATGVHGALAPALQFEEPARLDKAAKTAGGMRDMDVVAHVRFAARHGPVPYVRGIHADCRFTLRDKDAARLVEHAIAVVSNANLVEKRVPVAHQRPASAFHDEPIAEHARCRADHLQ